MHLNSFFFFGIFTGDEGKVVEVDADGGVVLQQQWVTLTASMWPEPTASSRGWRISAERLPILAAVFCGAALVVCLLCGFLLYRCCVMPRREKHFCKYHYITEMECNFGQDKNPRNPSTTSYDT